MKIDRIWLKNYPEDVPTDIDPQRFTSVAEMIEECFKTYGQRKAQTLMGTAVRYSDIDTYSMQIASYLQSLGLTQGDRVAVMMPNILQYTVASLAILRAGYVLVNINPMYTARELEHQLNDADAKAIFIVDTFAHTLEKVLSSTPVQHVILTSIGDLIGGVKGWFINKALSIKGMIPPYKIPQAISFKEALLRGEFKLADFQKPTISGNDVALLQYTGGTTGISKGATLLHSNLIANVLQTYTWVLPALKKITSQKEQLVFIGALPFYHIFAFTINLLICFYVGGNNILITDPRDLDRMLNDMKRQRFHVLPAVSTLFNSILHHPQASLIDWSSLQLSVAGGMSVPQSTIQAWHQLTGCCMVEGYGMSETSPVISATRVDLNIAANEPQQPGIGYPIPSTEVILLDDKDQPVGLNTPGELAVRGPQVMAGYWNSPEETAQVMTADGFLRTGDIAVMDEQGWIRIVDRKKDMILVSGFNVYPNEIEDVVSHMEHVSECVAVGVPDEKSGEAVAIIIVKRNPALTAEQVKAWCKDRLTGYKRPRYILFKESLPKSTVGKILRRELRPLLNDVLTKDTH